MRYARGDVSTVWWSITDNGEAVVTAAARFVCRSCGATSPTGGTCDRGHDEFVDATDDPMLGAEIAGYRVTRRIGRGGMGAVYRAVQPAIDAEVAIKILAAELAGEPESTERFIAEAKIANLVRHEALVKVIGLGVLPDGRPYQIMEHLTGVPLADVIYESRSRPLATLLERLADSLRAIHVMHARGIVHRDLKPSNLFATTAGFLKVLDFGIAKLAEARAGLTRTGHSIGTPGYMSPEQASAEPVDLRTDIYAMGVVLFEATAQRRPFEGRVIEALATGEAPAPLAGSVDGATPELDAVIAKAMAHDPADRYASAEEMASALDAVAAGLPPTAFGPLLDDELLARASGPQVVPGTPPPPISVAPPTVGPATRKETPNARGGETTQRQLGRFVVQGTVGEGGEGRVLLGVDPAIQRKVALKLVRSGGAERRERMIAEARAMAKINHPNVVTLYELGEDGDQLFLAMEYLEAIDLSRWLADQRRPPAEIVAMFVEAGRGLAAAHAAGVTHRDFKPANVLLGVDGRPRVGDFGIANLGGEVEGGQGTLAYMPPEQLEGGTVDPRSDQFAFCASLWHALFGAPPFARPDMPALAVALAAHRGPPKVPERTGVPARITAALHRGLAADPAERFGSMTALLAALAPRQRRRVVGWIAGGALVTVAMVAAIVMASRPSTGERPRETEPPLGLTQVAKLPPGDRLRVLARQPRSLRTSTEARELIGDTVATTGIVRTITLPGDPVAGTLAISDSGRWIASAVTGGVWLQAFDAPGKRVATLTLPPLPETPSQLFVDEEAGTVRALGVRALYQISLCGGTWTMQRTCPDRAFDRALSDPMLRTLHCTEPANTSEERVLRPRLLFSDDGRYVVKVGVGPLELQELSGGAAPVTIEAAPGAYIAVGRHTLAIAEGNGLRLRDHATGKELRWSAGLDLTINQVYIVAERPLELLVVRSDQRLATVGLDGSGAPALTQITPREMGVLRGVFSGNGRVIASFVDRTLIDDAAAGTSWELLGAANAMVANRSATRVALLDGRTLRVWDVAQRRPSVIGAGLSVVQHGRSELVTDRAGGDGLDWFDVSDVDAKIATLPLPAGARLISGTGPGVYWRHPDGTVWEWTKGATSRSLGSYPRIGGVASSGSRYFGLVRRRVLFELGTGKPVCAEEPAFVHMLSDDARHALTFQASKISLCDPSTGVRTTLEITPADAEEMNWQFGTDSSVLFALPTGIGALREVTVFDTATGKRIPYPGLENVRVTNLIDGNRDGLALQSEDGTFWIRSTGTTRLHEPAAQSSTTFDLVARRIVHRDDRVVTVWDLRGAPVARTVARTRALTLDNGRLFSFDHAIANEQHRTSVPRTDITVWSLEPPPIDDTEAWLSLAAD
ncbi:MAG: serine/threonine protein kinase [Myxococcales bacterium]|nr:serine/threonine protein kinase [Myxococcales bacterium]